MKWKRTFIESASKGGSAREEGDHTREEARYKTRMLACTKCGAKQETKGIAAQDYRRLPGHPLEKLREARKSTKESMQL